VSVNLWSSELTLPKGNPSELPLFLMVSEFSLIYVITLSSSNVDLAYEPGERCNSNSPIQVQVSQVKKEGDKKVIGFY
jgi:hypothetical protein